MKILFILLALITILFADTDDELQWATENFTYHFDIDNDGKKDTITQLFSKVDMRNAENHIVIKATSADNLEYDVGSYSYYRFQSCGRGCIKITDSDWGIWSESYYRYYYYDKKRRSWFLKKEVLEGPHFNEPDPHPVLYKRDIDVIYYDSSERIDGKIIPILQDNALKKLLFKLKNRDATTINSIKEGYLKYYLQHIPLTKENIWIYNNIAYYLQGEEFSYYQILEGVYILNEIIKYDPSRTVAYLNLADAYHQIDEQNLSKQSYKQYITLMKKQKKDKISKRVYKND